MCSFIMSVSIFLLQKGEVEVGPESKIPDDGEMGGSCLLTEEVKDLVPVLAMSQVYVYRLGADWSVLCVRCTL